MHSKKEGEFRYKGKLDLGKSYGWREKILQELHDSAVGGNSGIIGTDQRGKKERSYWSRLKEAVHAHGWSCDVWQMPKGEHVHSPGLLQPIPLPHGPWQGVSVDFLI